MIAPEIPSAAFLYAVIVGIIIGVVYDFFKINRVFFGIHGLLEFVTDIIFCMIAFSAFAVFIFNASLGRIRFFAFAGVVFGFFIYYFTVARLTFAVSKKLNSFFARRIERLKRNIKYRIYIIIRRIQTFIDKRMTAKAAVIRETVKYGNGG